MRIIFTIFLIPLLLVATGQSLPGRNQQLRFEHITMTDGLSNNWATRIIQDRKGYIWIGTFDGLNKYDGYSFTTYKFDPLDSNSLSQNFVYDILEDKDGVIWISTFEGLCRFDRTTEKFTRYKPDPKSKFSDPNIIAIEEDNNGMMWLGAASGQLARFEKHTGMFYNENLLADDKRKTDSLLRDGINCSYKDNDGVLWIGTFTGLYQLSIQPASTGRTGEFKLTPYTHQPGNDNSLSSNYVMNIFGDKQGVLWIVTPNALNSFNRKTNQFKRYTHDPNDTNSISSDSLIAWGAGRTLAEDLEGNLWIGTSNGLNKLNKERTTFTVYKHQLSDPTSINEDQVVIVFVDSSGVLWAGTQTKGLNKANLIQKPFGLKQKNSENPISNNNVTAILEDNSGIIWIGTEGGGLNRWDKKTDRVTHFRHEQKKPGSLRYDYVYAMLEDRDGNLWVCNGDMLSLLNKQAGQFTHYNSNPKKFQDFDHRSIYSITEDKEGDIWLGTGNGVKRFDKKEKVFKKHYYHDPADPLTISDYTAQAIFADSRNNIWVGYGSIATDRIEKKSDVIHHYKHDAKNPFSISSNIVNSFYEDTKGNLWLATAAGGLCKYDYETGKFTAFTDKHGLAGNTVYSILEDDNRHLWLGTSNGISRFDPIKKVFTNYDHDDGLQGNMFAAGHRFRPSKFRGQDGIMYFGGENGFNFFNPAEIKPSDKLAEVVITQFRLFDSLVKGANEAKKIVLRHDENYFSFEFASLSFFNADKNQYRYKLEGVDRDWVNSGARRYAAYTDIKPGNYTFSVMATNNDGVWNEQGVSILVIVRPPWWKTWWAYCIYGLLLVAAIIVLHRFQKQRVVMVEREKAQRKELEQAKEIEKAYYELKKTQQQLIHAEKMASLGELTAGIAHEIQNPLNFVNNFSEVNDELLKELKAEVEKSNIEEVKAIASVLEFNSEKINHHGKRADAIVKGMLQHSRTSSGQKEPTDINALADEYLRLAYHGIRAKDKSFNATMKTDFDESIGKINIIPQDIGRAILNLINNAFYGVDEKKKLLGDDFEPIVTVATRSLKPPSGGLGVLISVKDNGNGIPQKIIDKIFQPFFTTKPTGQGTGLGLSLAYDIITKGHGGELKVQTKEGEGSEFIVLLP